MTRHDPAARVGADVPLWLRAAVALWLRAAVALWWPCVHARAALRALRWRYCAPPGAFLLERPAPLPTPVRPLRHQVLDRRDPRLLRHVLARAQR